MNSVADGLFELSLFPLCFALGDSRVHANTNALPVSNASGLKLLYRPAIGSHVDAVSGCAR